MNVYLKADEMTLHRAAWIASGDYFYENLCFTAFRYQAVAVCVVMMGYSIYRV